MRVIFEVNMKKHNIMAFISQPFSCAPSILFVVLFMDFIDTFQTYLYVLYIVYEVHKLLYRAV